MGELVMVGRAAQELAVSDKRAYEMCRTGILPPGVAIKMGRQWRVDMRALRQWIADGGQGLPGGWRKKPVAGVEGNCGR